MVDEIEEKEEAKPEPKKSSALVPMIVASLVMVGAAYATVTFVLKPMLHPEAATASRKKCRRHALHGRRGRAECTRARCRSRPRE